MINNVGAVIIGRNEGDRLKASLKSVKLAGLFLVYADSGSSDESADFAEKLGIPVVRLDADRPFSAARGRNEGLAELLLRSPETHFVIFLDGDCILEPSFPSAALSKFREEPNCAIVAGHLTERDPDASVYNRLCAIEWKSPAGQIVDGKGLGGIMAVRVAALQGVGGFNEQAIAGEEADLAVRLAKRGWSIFKINVPMATHDAEITRFSQWWRRTIRAGHAMAHRYLAAEGSYRAGRPVRSAFFWGFFLPVVVLILAIPTRGMSVALLLGYAWLGLRIYRYYRAMGHSRSDSLLVARYLSYAKVPEFLGVIRYLVNRLRGRFYIVDWR